MSFQVESLTTIRFSVADVQKSRDWYQTFFDVSPIEDQPNFTSFKIGNMTLELCLADAKSPVSNGGCVGYWMVDNLDKAILKAKSLGAQTYRGPLRVEETQKTIVQIIDPLGNIFGLEST